MLCDLLYLFKYSPAIFPILLSISIFLNDDKNSSISILSLSRITLYISAIWKGVINKLLHITTVQLRKAAYQGDESFLQIAQQLFDLES